MDVLMINESQEEWEVVKSLTDKHKRREPIRAARKNSRMAHKTAIPLHQLSSTDMPGTSTTVNNSFAILNSMEDDELEEIAMNCDVTLGNSEDEIAETISAMQAEEMLRGVVAETNYKLHLESKLKEQHVLEGENLILEGVTNSNRDFEGGGFQRSPRAQD